MIQELRHLFKMKNKNYVSVVKLRSLHNTRHGVSERFNASYLRCCSINSERGTLRSLRVNVLNRPIADEAGTAAAAFATPLPSGSVWFCRLAIFANQLRIGQPPPGYRRCHLAEPSAIVVFALVEPEGLFIQVGIKVDRVNANISALQRPLQERPEILNAVRVDV